MDVVQSSGMEPPGCNCVAGHQRSIRSHSTCSSESNVTEPADSNRDQRCHHEAGDRQCFHSEVWWGNVGLSHNFPRPAAGRSIVRSAVQASARACVEKLDKKVDAAGHRMQSSGRRTLAAASCLRGRHCSRRKWPHAAGADVERPHRRTENEGLQVCSEKFRLRSNTEAGRRITIDGALHKVLSSPFRLLGSWISPMADDEYDTDRRIGISHGLAVSWSPSLEAPTVSDELKAKVIETCVRPAVSWNRQSWTLPALQWLRLLTALRVMLRRTVRERAKEDLKYLTWLRRATKFARDRWQQLGHRCWTWRMHETQWS
mmetsp:Transcript_24778/g.55110  ORF Transcript_24778/g.55110 Transcript_24778/m.55110 type:complete len:316 (+) Transcript_24778:45-992(+)